MDDTHVAVLLEEIRGQFQVFGERLQNTEEKLGAKIEVLQTDVTDVKQRVTGIEQRATRIEDTLNGTLPRATRRKPRK